MWHTCGHFSKNGSFIVKNYLTSGLLWYGHKCVRGKDDVVEEELYEGTAKSMEGVLADECYEQAKNERCKVEVVWQYGDSSAAKSISLHHPAGKVYKCGGHVGRAHSNNLREAAKKKEFSEDMKSKYKAKFPEIETAKCKCKRHRAGCGCISDSFTKGARINHFCCLQQCTNPGSSQSTMCGTSMTGTKVAPVTFIQQELAVARNVKKIKLNALGSHTRPKHHSSVIFIGLHTSRRG